MAFSYEFTEKDRETHDAMQLHWSKITLAEFRTFIGIVLAIRCISSKRFDDYFNETDPKYGNEWIAMHISKARFHQILNNFHYNIDTVLARVSELCQTHWTPYQRVTFDETIMPFLGMFYGLKHIPTKPHPNGVLLHMLADSAQFIWDFDFFIGLILPPKYQILDIVKKLQRKQKHYIITTDSKWGSEELARVLDERQCLFLLSCKKNSPSYIFDNLNSLTKNVGQSSAMYSKTDQSTIAACSFHDANATINLMSNYVSDKFSWHALGPKVVPPSPGVKRTPGKPLCNQEYTYSKGFVDEAARQLHTYDWPHKTKKWTVVMFHTLLTICAWNAFVYRNALHVKDTDKKLNDFRNFLSTIANQLAKVRLRNQNHPSKLMRPRNNKQQITLRKYNPSVEVGNLHISVPYKSVKPGKGRQQHWCEFCPKRKRQITTNTCLACSCAAGKPVSVCETCMAKHQKRTKFLSLF